MVNLNGVENGTQSQRVAHSRVRALDSTLLVVEAKASAENLGKNFLGIMVMWTKQDTRRPHYCKTPSRDKIINAPAIEIGVFDGRIDFVLKHCAYWVV